MIRRSLKRSILSLVIIFLLCSTALCKSGDEHIRDWKRVFATDYINEGGRRNLNELWNLARKIIDDPDYNDLHSRFEWLKFNAGEHRFFFHWGFNTNPEHYEPLKRFITKRLETYAWRQNMTQAQTKDFVKAQYKEFFTYLTKRAQPERNRKLINTIVRTTGIPTTRGYAGAIATIIHDVHLLGDYSTTATDALPQISDIQRDLLDAGFGRLLDNDSNGKEQLRKIRAAFRSTEKNINSRRAELLMNEVERFLPKILDERFGSDVLKRKGIMIKVPEEEK